MSSRMTDAPKIDDTAALAAIAELTASHLLQRQPGQGSRVRITDADRARYRQIRAAIDQLTARLYVNSPPTAWPPRAGC